MICDVSAHLSYVCHRLHSECATPCGSKSKHGASRLASPQTSCARDDRTNASAAFYLAYGICPTERKEDYILNHATFGHDRMSSWRTFLKQSSLQLSTSAAWHHTYETCICMRLRPLHTFQERRVFHYHDSQVHADGMRRCQRCKAVHHISVQCASWCATCMVNLHFTPSSLHCAQMWCMVCAGSPHHTELHTIL